MDQTHNPEFTACEFYWAYADFYDLMDFTEEMISSLVLEINGSYIVKVHDENKKEYEVDFTRPWKRVSMMEELAKTLEIDVPEDLETDEARAFFDDLCKKKNVDCGNPRTTARLIDKLVGQFIEEECINPTFLIQQPQMMCPLAKYHRSIPGVTERFELLINKHEYINAYTELNDPFRQKELFLHQVKVRISSLSILLGTS